MKKFRIAFIALLVIAVIAIIVLYLSTHTIAVLEPDGRIGRSERDLFYAASILMLVVVIPAITLCLVFAWVYRASNKKVPYRPDWDESKVGEVIWWTIPLLIMLTLGVVIWKTSHDLNPFSPIDRDTKPVTIQVVALQWKWLFIYPEEGIATVNYIAFPAKTPIRFQITADAPMNSFWIPRLGGQIYAMPAMRSELHLIADKEQEFHGYSAQISGTGFAGMEFLAKAVSDQDYKSWIQEAKRSGKHLTIDEYKQLVMPSQSVPVTLYNLKQSNLFELILNQYEPGEKAL